MTAPHSLPLFDGPPPREVPLGPGAVLLRGFAGDADRDLLAGVERVAAGAPFRRMVTPRGFSMSVLMTSCGPLGWISDRRGYRYEPADPATGLPWPPMPEPFVRIARSAASRAGFPDFEPDSCLVNRYEQGAKMSLHQDRDERDFGAPIVSVSLGLPAVFQFGGEERTDRAERVDLAHGDVVVWGGPARLRFHGVLPLRPGEHPLTGPCRVNLTFRKASPAKG